MYTYPFAQFAFAVMSAWEAPGRLSTGHGRDTQQIYICDEHVLWTELQICVGAPATEQFMDCVVAHAPRVDDATRQFRFIKKSKNNLACF